MTSTLTRIRCCGAVACGRLVEMPAEIIAVVENYLNAGVVDVESCLVTAYDFLSDSGESINQTLQSFNLTPNTLINDTWSRSDLESNWSGMPPDLVSVNAHFEHWNAIPADLGGLLLSTDLSIANSNLSNQIAYSMGCHGGFSLPDGQDLSYGGPGYVPDFPQRLALGGAAAWVSNTGYGYGMDDAATNSELLYLYFTQELGKQANMPIGQALVNAKQRYLNGASTSGFGIYDEKSIIEATLYGLPMTDASVPSPKPPGPTEGLTATPTGSTTEPNGLQSVSYDVALEPILNTTPYGDYYSLGGEPENVYAGPGRPVVPRGSFVADPPADDSTLHGVILTNATFETIAFENPLITRPFTDVVLPEPDFNPTGWFPNKVWTANRFGNRPDVVVIGGQFNNQSQILDLFSNMQLQAFFASADTADFAPPVINWALATEINDGLQFRVATQDDHPHDTGVFLVMVTYEVPGVGSSRSWQSDELAFDPELGLWTGLVEGLDSDTRFFVQACDNAGNCAFKDDKFLVPLINEVGDEHTFWVTVMKDEGNGNGFVPVEGVKPIVTLTKENPDAKVTIVTDTCLDTGTDANGQCSVTFSTDAPGNVSVHAEVSFSVEGKDLYRETNGEMGNSADGVKSFVDARVTIEPDGAVREVGDPLSFAVTVKQNTGTSDTFEPVEGVFPIIAFPDGAPDYIEDQCQEEGTDSQGTCTVTVNSSTAGNFTALAEVSLELSGLNLIRNDQATVTYIDAEVSISPGQATNSAGEPHAFTIQITQDLGNGPEAVAGFIPDTNFLGSQQPNVAENTCQEGTDANGECIVVINSDMAGIFTLEVTVNLTVGSVQITREATATKTYWSGRIVPTNTTCEDLVNGTAEDLTEIIYRVKGNQINSVAPGVFFYYSHVTAPGERFTVDIVQENDPEFPYFLVQNEQQVRLYNTDCSEPDVSLTSSIGNGQATLEIEGATTEQIFIVSTKYETSNVVDHQVSKPAPTIHYTYKTKIGETVINQDIDGLDLRPK
jgi:hypothetical protein